MQYNKCPNCGLPLLLIDSQGNQLYKCEVAQDPSSRDGALRSLGLFRSTTETILSGDVATDYAVEPWAIPTQRPGVSQRLLWLYGGVIAVWLVLLVAWLLYSKLTG